MNKLNIKALIETLVESVIKEQRDEEELRVWGEKEAIEELQNWMFVANPHGTTKQEFIRYLNKELTPKYGKEAVLLAFDTLKREKGCLVMKTTKAGKEIVVWDKKAC